MPYFLARRSYAGDGRFYGIPGPAQDHIARLMEVWDAGKASLGEDRMLRLVLARPRLVPTQEDMDVTKAQATATMKATDKRCMKSQKPGYGDRARHNELLLSDLIGKLLEV